MAVKYWLVKGEPDCYSIDDLAADKDQTTFWDGVRNYQARNMLRDEFRIGDKVLFYHSNSDPTGVVGVCEVVKDGYPDFTAFDPEHMHFDPKSSPDNPTWFMVDIRLVKKFNKPVLLSAIKENPKLSGMQLVKRGNRLSVMPVTKEEFSEIVKMGK